jgi:hypothetical protein
LSAAASLRSGTASRPRAREVPLRCSLLIGSSSRNCFDLLRQEVERITGVEVGEATSEVGRETGTGVPVFLLARSVPVGT